jgi:hypothetical protein
LTYATYVSIFPTIVTVIFRPVLRDLQPSSRTPIDYRKAFLKTREMVFMCVISISIHWLFCNFCAAVFCFPQFASLSLCKPPPPHPFGIRCIWFLDHLLLHSHRSEPHAESFHGNRRDMRMNRKLERVWSSKRSMSISTFEFIYCDGTVCETSHKVQLFVGAGCHCQID